MAVELCLLYVFLFTPWIFGRDRKPFLKRIIVYLFLLAVGLGPLKEINKLL